MLINSPFSCTWYILVPVLTYSKWWELKENRYWHTPECGTVRCKGVSVSPSACKNQCLTEGGTDGPKLNSLRTLKELPTQRSIGSNYTLLKHLYGKSALESR